MTTAAGATPDRVEDVLDLHADPVALTAALVDIPSVSQNETRIADAVHAACLTLAAAAPAEYPIEVLRYNNNVLARTQRGLGERVILAGHLDTVPLADNLPSRLVPAGEQGHPAAAPATEEMLFGCGSVDMKSGDAVALHAFATLATAPELAYDLTVIMYECEEISTQYNGLGHLATAHPEWLNGDVALLHEPSGGVIEAGCQGTLRLKVHATGTRAHSARAWLGDNAIHTLGGVLQTLAAYQPRDVEIDGCVYKEGLQAVRMSAGVAGNTVPDAAWVEINFRFAPDRSVEQALEHVFTVLGLDPAATSPETATHHLYHEITDTAAGALPGLQQPAAASLIAATGGVVRAKYGWTDVSRFAALGIPAVNFGPGDPSLAHKPEEHCPTEQIRAVADTLKTYLQTPPR